MVRSFLFNAAPSTSPRSRFGTLPKQAAVMLAAATLASVAVPASASSGTETRVVRCGSGSCLLVTGYRNDPAQVVRINGQPVPVAGKHDWRAVVPVDTVRRWSEPHAREIEVSLHDPRTQDVTSKTVDLPIGLLGEITDLAALEISIR